MPTGRATAATSATKPRMSSHTERVIAKSPSELFGAQQRGDQVDQQIKGGQPGEHQIERHHPRSPIRNQAAVNSASAANAASQVKSAMRVVRLCNVAAGLVRSLRDLGEVRGGSDVRSGCPA